MTYFPLKDLLHLLLHLDQFCVVLSPLILDLCERILEAHTEVRKKCIHIGTNFGFNKDQAVRNNVKCSF